MGDITLHLGPNEPVTIYLHWFDNNNVDLWTSISLDVSEEKVLWIRALGEFPYLVPPGKAFQAKSEREFTRVADALTERERIRMKISDLEFRAQQLRKTLENK